MKQILKFNELFEKLNLLTSGEEYDSIKYEYGVKTKINKDIIKYADDAIIKFKSKIKLWKDIKIIFVNDINGEFLGRFRSETSTSTPIIMLSDSEILKGAKEYNVPLIVAVETTIFHELGHAICELERDIFGYMYLQYGDEEQWAEDFGFYFHDYNEIPEDLEEFIEEYNKIK